MSGSSSSSSSTVSGSGIVDFELKMEYTVEELDINDDCMELDNHLLELDDLEHMQQQQQQLLQQEQQQQQQQVPCHFRALWGGIIIIIGIIRFLSIHPGMYYGWAQQQKL